MSDVCNVLLRLYVRVYMYVVLQLLPVALQSKRTRVTELPRRARRSNFDTSDREIDSYFHDVDISGQIYFLMICMV